MGPNGKPDPADQPDARHRARAVQAALHKIKLYQGLGGADAVVIYDNGDVASKVSGDDIGNLYDED